MIYIYIYLIVCTFSSHNIHKQHSLFRCLPRIISPKPEVETRPANSDTWQMVCDQVERNVSGANSVFYVPWNEQRVCTWKVNVWNTIRLPFVGCHLYRCKLWVSERVADQFVFFLVGLASNYDRLEGKVLLWICLRIPDPFIKWGAIGVTRFYPHLSQAAIRSQQNPRCCPRWRHALRVVSNPTRRFGSIWLL